MKFEPLYYSDRLHLINPEGDIGIVTLWSRVEQLLHLLTQLEIDLSPHTSRIAVIGNLYGNGLPQMLRNLLWNPQITHMLALGQNLSGSKEELVHFFSDGLEPVEFLGVATHRIIGTTRIIDHLVTPEDFKNGLQIYPLGKLSDKQTGQEIIQFFNVLPDKIIPQVARKNVPIPKTQIQRYPSEPRAHTILKPTPLEAWKEVIFRLVRFGYPHHLKKGLRIELQNVKVIIENPMEESEEHLQAYGFSLSHFKNYQKSILNAQCPSEQSYTYGHRLRAYFQDHTGTTIDSLKMIIQRLNEDRQTRHAYTSLWDNHRDLPEGHGCPCLVSLFFRYFDNQLTLTASFRTHNAMDAWLENVYGLIAILRYVAEYTHLSMGAITILSHSLSLSGDVMEKAKAVAHHKNGPRSDSRTGEKEQQYDDHGHFMVTTDGAEIIVQHLYEGAVIGEYRGKTALALEKQLTRDCAISEISHALYLGREIAKKEAQLKSKNSER